tara:strand:- start:285 stop:788 length:504 start_codon:yes stop_codon:yes gene_type:complete
MEIYRYKFSNTYSNEVQQTFINVHRFDKPDVFKTAWNAWIGKNNELVEREKRRLFNLGYKGDIADKMYKSVRYYYKNKSTIKNEPKKRRTYIRLDKDTLAQMDEFICTRKNKNAKPSESFQMFLEKHKDLVEAIKTTFSEKGVEEDYIDLKIKKTFKNRCFNHFKNI